MAEEPQPIDPNVDRFEQVPDRPGPLSLVKSRWDVLLVIAIGGALGSLARWSIGHALPRSADGFPSATFLENVSGALCLGVLMVVVLDLWPTNRYARPFAGVGVLGGYTTFSTYALEIRDLLAAGDAGTAIAYLFVSVAAGLLAVWLGMGSARLALRFVRRGPGEAAG